MYQKQEIPTSPLINKGTRNLVTGGDAVHAGAVAEDYHTASPRPDIIIVKVTQNGKKARILKECYKIQNACYI